MSILFFQKRSIRAGAQTSLARLVESSPLRPMNPVALLGGAGWLSEELQRQGTPALITRFPSPRALMSRMLGFGMFARRVIGMLHSRAVTPAAIIANDHQECPLAFALAEKLGGIPVLGILRTPGMSRADFDKYGCDRCNGLMGEGTELRERVQAWTSKDVGLFEEGFAEAEFLPLKVWPAACPKRVLVIGSEAPRKGFLDFIEAVRRLEAEVPAFPGFECDFTGSRPADLPQGPTRSIFHFLGRVDDFPSLVRRFELAVHPSRAETFGMAPIEALIAGTPTLVSLTGEARRLALPGDWTFPPGDVSALSDRLAGLWRRWPALDLQALQAQVRHGYHLDRTAGRVRHELLKLGLS